MAKDRGVRASVLEETREVSYQAAKKTEKNPRGDSWLECPFGRSRDGVSGKADLDKTFHCNSIPDFAVKSELSYVIISMSVTHYGMSGLETDCDFAALGLNGKAISGLYAAGEMAGDAHGNSHLEGDSLLVCVVLDCKVAAAIRN